MTETEIQLQQRIELLEGLVFRLIKSDKYLFNRDIDMLENQNIKVGISIGTKIGTLGGASGQKIGFFGVTPVVQRPTYTITNLTTDKSYDANATSTDELADVLGTLIADLKSLGLIVT